MYSGVALLSNSVAMVIIMRIHFVLVSLHYIPSYKKQDFQSVIYIVYQQVWETSAVDDYSAMVTGRAMSC